MYKKYRETLSHQGVEKAVIEGNLDKCRSLGKNALRVFVSSTFTDSKGERNYLMRDIFPRIREFCLARGVEFGVVDFRWGIRDFATNDHKTTEICMAEIDKCFNDSIDAPCFIFLSFNRYGWNPLPRTVDAGEFEVILENITDVDKRTLVTDWYKLDNNSAHPQYVLQAISTHIPKFTDRKADIETTKTLRKEWSQTEARLQESLTSAALGLSSLTDRDKIKWRISVTDMEVRRGILDRCDPDRCLCIIRDIQEFEDVSDMDPAHKRMIGRHVELENRPGLRVDEITRDKISQLRAQVKMAGVKCKEFNVKWTENGIQEETHTEYMKEVGNLVYDFITSGVKTALAKAVKLDSVTQEIVSHGQICLKRTSSFHGREEMMIECLKYFQPVPGTRCPLVIHGESGSGKTSFISSMARRASSGLTAKSHVLVIRFCGTTPNSTSGKSLLQNICQHISRAYQPESEAWKSLPCDFKLLRRELLRVLQMATGSMPLLLFLDSLDQLSDDDNARSQMSWLPTFLPPHVYIVVSTLPREGGCLQALKGLEIPPHNFIRIEPLGEEDAAGILDLWLEQAGRSLQPEQRTAVLKAATDGTRESPSPLRLKLLFDIALKLRSFDKVPAVPVTVSTLVSRYLSEIEEVHGELLVYRLFGLLAVSRHGLSEEMLTDLLAGDEEVMDSVLQYHRPPIRRIPQIVFSRLRYDLGEYVVERGAYGISVLGWYHRLFWEEARRRYAASYYYEDLDTTHKARRTRRGLPENVRKQQHTLRLQHYFSGQLHKTFPDRGISVQPLYWTDSSSSDTELAVRFNQLCLAQLPRAAIDKYDSQRLEDVLCNLDFLAAKCAAGMAIDLLNDFLIAKRSPRCSKRLQEYSHFISRNVNTYEKSPQMILQDALNMHKSSMIYQDAIKYEGTPTPWLKDAGSMVVLRNKTGQDPCVLSINAHSSQVTCLLFLPQVWMDCPTKYLVSGSLDGTIAVWHCGTGESLLTLDCGAPVQDVTKGALTTSTTELVAICSDGRLLGWKITIENVEEGVYRFLSETLLNKTAHDGEVLYASVLASRNGTNIITAVTSKTGSGNDLVMGNVQVWHKQGQRVQELNLKSSDELIGNKKSHRSTAGIRCLAYSPNQRFVLIGLAGAANEDIEVNSSFVICTSSDLSPVWQHSAITEPVLAIAMVPTKKSPSWYTICYTPEMIILILMSERKCNILAGLVIARWQHHSSSPFIAVGYENIISGNDMSSLIWDFPAIDPLFEPEWTNPEESYTDLLFPATEDPDQKEDTAEFPHPASVRQERGATLVGRLVGPGGKVSTVLPWIDIAISGDSNGHIYIWDPRLMDTSGPVKHAVQECALSPSGQNAVSWCTVETANSRLGCLRLWDVLSGTFLGDVVIPELQDINKLLFSPDGNYIHLVSALTPEICTIAINDLTTPSTERTLTKEMVHLKTPFDKSSLHDVAMSADGLLICLVKGPHCIVAVDKDGQANILEKLSRVISNGGVEVSEDGLTLVWVIYEATPGQNKSSVQSEIILWNLNSHVRIHKTVTNHDTGSLTAASLIPSSDVLVTGSNTGRLHLWSYDREGTREGDDIQLQRVVKAHDNPVHNLAPSICGRYVVTTSGQWLKVWIVPQLSLSASYRSGVPLTSLVVCPGIQSYLNVICGTVTGDLQFLSINLPT